MPDWENPTETEDDKRERLCLELRDLHAAEKNIKEKIAPLAERINAYFPDGPGEHEVFYNNTRVVVKRSEKLEWDSDILEQMFVTTPMPPHVKQRLSVNKKDFEKLPELDQKDLIPALTRKVGSTKITVG